MNDSKLRTNRTSETGLQTNLLDRSAGSGWSFDTDHISATDNAHCQQIHAADRPSLVQSIHPLFPRIWARLGQRRSATRTRQAVQQLRHPQSLFSFWLLGKFPLFGHQLHHQRWRRLSALHGNNTILHPKQVESVPLGSVLLRGSIPARYLGGALFLCILGVFLCSQFLRSACKCKRAGDRICLQNILWFGLAAGFGKISERARAISA